MLTKVEQFISYSNLLLAQQKFPLRWPIFWIGIEKSWRDWSIISFACGYLAVYVCAARRTRPWLRQCHARAARSGNRDSYLQAITYPAIAKTYDGISFGKSGPWNRSGKRRGNYATNVLWAITPAVLWWMEEDAIPTLTPPALTHARPLPALLLPWKSLRLVVHVQLQTGENLPS